MKIEPHPEHQIEALRSFPVFLWHCLKVLGKTPTDTQTDIAHELETDIPNLMIQAQRGVGKSWVLSFYILYRLYWNPSINILVVSFSQSKALEHTTMILRLMAEQPEFQWLHPSRRVDQPDNPDFELRKSKDKFDVALAPVSQAPSVKAVGITGMITGSRAHLILADDIETSENSETLTMREKLKKAVEEFTDIASPEGCQIIFLGTPQCEDTMYASLPDRGYVVKVWPAQYPLKEHLPLYGNYLAKTYRDRIAADPSLCDPVSLGGLDPDGGQPTDRRFPAEVLLRKRIGHGRSGYRLQYMLNPTASNADKFPLRLRDLIVFDAPDMQAPPELIYSSALEQTDADLPNVGFRNDRLQRPFKTQGDFIPYQDSLLYIDPSGRGADETAYCVVKRLNGFVFLLKQGGFRDGYGEKTLQALANIARDFQVKRVVTEDDFGDGMFRTLMWPVLARTYNCGIEGVKVARGRHKAQRIVETLEPVTSSHRLVVHPRCFVDDMENINGVPPEQQIQYRLWWQYTRVTKERDCIPHDDRLDALAGAIANFQDGLQVDTAKNSAAAVKAASIQKFREIAKEYGMTEVRNSFLSPFLGPQKAPEPPNPVKTARGGRYRSFIISH